jgi:hypothetical protein
MNEFEDFLSSFLFISSLNWLHSVNNVLFKFAVDSDGMYANDDTSAAKVASQELKGLMAYTSLGIRGLCVPLMAVVDFMGYRVIAMSLLPIGSETIVYGTCDAGVSVNMSNPKMNEMMKKAGQVASFFVILC